MVRVYFLPGCPHCFNVIQKLSAAKVPVQLQDVTNDPFFKFWCDMHYGTVSVPVTVDFVHGLIVNGDKEEDIAKIISSFAGTQPPNGSADTESAVQSAATAVSAPDGVPDVSGSVAVAGSSGGDAHGPN